MTCPRTRNCKPLSSVLISHPVLNSIVDKFNNIAGIPLIVPRVNMSAAGEPLKNDLRVVPFSLRENPADQETEDVRQDFASLWTMILSLLLLLASMD